MMMIKIMKNNKKRRHRNKPQSFHFLGFNPSFHDHTKKVTQAIKNSIAIDHERPFVNDGRTVGDLKLVTGKHVVEGTSWTSLWRLCDVNPKILLK